MIRNTWTYHRIYTTGFSYIQFTTSINYIVTIVSDTIMPNSKRYFKIVGLGTNFQRLDSATMNVYSYSSGGSECLIDSLLSRINNNFISCWENFLSPYNVDDTNQINFAGSLRRAKRIHNTQISHVYNLINGIGLSYQRACEFGGAIYSLKGCVINGIVYGDTSLTALNQISSEIPKEFFLSQNYPNPFNPSTNIKFH